MLLSCCCVHLFDCFSVLCMCLVLFFVGFIDLLLLLPSLCVVCVFF